MGNSKPARALRLAVCILGLGGAALADDDVPATGNPATVLELPQVDAFGAKTGVIGSNRSDASISDRHHE